MKLNSKIMQRTIRENNFLENQILRLLTNIPWNQKGMIFTSLVCRAAEKCNMGAKELADSIEHVFNTGERFSPKPENKNVIDLQTVDWKSVIMDVETFLGWTKVSSMPDQDQHCQLQRIYKGVRALLGYDNGEIPQEWLKD